MNNLIQQSIETILAHYDNLRLHNKSHLEAMQHCQSRYGVSVFQMTKLVQQRGSLGQSGETVVGVASTPQGP